MKVALRTQQIIAEESGVAGTIDALGGSYAVERLTADIEKACFAYFAEIDRRGGLVQCIEDNFFQLEIANAAYDLYLRKERHEWELVGVTKYRDESANPALELHHVDEGAAERQLARLAAMKAKRDGTKVAAALAEVVRIAKTDANIMPATLDAVRARATGGEIIKALRPVFGAYVGSRSSNGDAPARTIACGSSATWRARSARSRTSTDRSTAAAATFRALDMGSAPFVTGVTGPPGGARQIDAGGPPDRKFRTGGETVAVVAVDPSSPFTRGAVLGDRVRMQRHAGDPGVEIRSMASRESGGGLAPATHDAIAQAVRRLSRVIIVRDGRGRASQPERSRS